jgi:phosphomannomutase
VLANLSGKATADLRVGLGRDMRLSAPELSARYRDGLTAEGAHVIDAGMVGTEMLYWLVGSRDLDGGLMCTASHNPKPYTGAKIVERGAVALSGERGLQDIRALIEEGLGQPPGGGSSEEVDVYADFQAHALATIDKNAIRPLKVVLDGGNGMAGPMVGPILEELPRVPRPRAEPAAARESRVRDRQGARDRRRPRDRLGRRRRPLLLHRRRRRVRAGRLRHRAARRLRARAQAGRRHPLRRARLARGA